MIRPGRETGKTLRTCELLRDYLLRHGPATAQDLLGILALSRAATYQMIRTAARRGFIRPVAHVHSDGNHDPLAWDIDSADRELLWRRTERLGGRFCTCIPDARRTRRDAVT
jgi:hypothetical protein